jgi:hypothetical protein
MVSISGKKWYVLSVVGEDKITFACISIFETLENL